MSSDARCRSRRDNCVVYEVDVGSKIEGWCSKNIYGRIGELKGLQLGRLTASSWLRMPRLTLCHV